MASKNVHPHGEQLSAYIDGMLDVGKTRGIAAHLRACDPCRSLSEQLQETRTLLRTMPTPPRPGPEFWTDNYRRLRVDNRERAVT
ncbi:MAG: zf-HC2 domain-containing protein, partial [Armatimonadota bacterium]|nr:zf-HC2 domain-containing protein [Armatimonadota bacterium]